MSKKFFLLLSISILLVLTLSSCATIMKGSSQKMHIDCNVKGATIEINGKVITKTPAVIKVKKTSKDMRVVVRKEGYNTKIIYFQSKITGWFWGNIFGSGSFGSSTDSSTGAMYEYSPGHTFIQLPSKTVGYKLKAKMRYFVLMNYDRINKDIAKGNGEYLKSVCAFYGIKNESGIKKMLPFLRKSQKDAQSIVDFSNYLVAKI